MSFFGAFALLFAAAQSAPSGVDVLGARFFAIDSRSDPAAIVETARIPHRAETSCFGWVLQVTPRAGSVTVREELRLPAPAASWGTAEGTTVHDDRAGATSELSDNVEDGLISNEWCLSEGDPLGSHRIRIFEGERLLHEFEFEVVAEPAGLPTI